VRETADHGAWARRGAAAGGLPSSLPRPPSSRACALTPPSPAPLPTLSTNPFPLSPVPAGAFNSWDRIPYSWRAWNASALDPLVTNIHSNFVLTNYHQSWPLDHDDGSNAYNDTSNFLVWGGSKQYLGFAKRSAGNAYIYADYTPAAVALANLGGMGAGAAAALEAKYGGRVGNGWGTCAMAYGTASFQPPLADTWEGNTCIVAASAHIFDFNGCHPATPNDGNIPALTGNTYATGDGAYALKCGGETWTLAQAQAAGVDVGSSLVPVPSNDAILALGHQLLGF
jgi:hypothetical protein